VDQWWEKGGVHVIPADLNAALQTAGVQPLRSEGGKSTPVSPGDRADSMTYLLHHGYTQWTSYQPSAWCWAFQWIEFGWLTALAPLLLTATVWLPRRRDA
jgi:hypothetical protein